MAGNDERVKQGDMIDREHLSTHHGILCSNHASALALTRYLFLFELSVQCNERKTFGVIQQETKNFGNVSVIWPFGLPMGWRYKNSAESFMS